ncbi:MAG TPA: F0F1 ATP synthase subunit gamma [Aldersonia sp.]
MAAQLRVLRRRIKSASAIKKITKAQEMIATSRISKAQARVQAARPYSNEMTNVLSALAGESDLDHPLLVERADPKRAGVLVISSDRGLCGGYNANVLRTGEELFALLRSEGKEPIVYAVGRKALAYYNFRGRDVANSWTNLSEQPTYQNAVEIADALVHDFVVGTNADDADYPGKEHGVDEVHIVFTEFKSMLTQSAVARRIAPMEVLVEETEEEGVSFEFEPEPEALFRALLPRYLATRVYAALLDSAASESAARRRAMKAATDNADELIKGLTLEANRARQAQITQEISEIVGGVDALAATGSDD